MLVSKVKPIHPLERARPFVRHEEWGVVDTQAPPVLQSRSCRPEPLLSQVAGAAFVLCSVLCRSQGEEASQGRSAGEGPGRCPGAVGPPW